MNQIELIKYYISNNQSFAVLVGGKKCAVCYSLNPKLNDFFKNKFSDIPFQYVQIEEIGILASEWMVLSVPAFLLFVNGRECVRKLGIFSLQLLEDEIERKLNVDIL